MILNEDQVAFDWVGTLVANDGNHFLTYEMLEVLNREMPKFSDEIRGSFDARDKETLIYQLDLMKESSMYCPMPKLTRQIDALLDRFDNDKYWPENDDIDLCDQLIDEVRETLQSILLKRQGVRGVA